MATLGNPKNTIAVLQKYQFNFQKKFGQNFLIDTGILEEIIEAAQITKDDFVLEIGPGIGTMTQYLCEAARAVVAVEIDTNLIPILKDTLAEYNNVDVLNEDILKVNISKLAEEKNNGKPIKVVANLPYYITTPIIMGLFESHVPIDSITIMVQKEVADRMQEGPGSKEYGALSLAVQYYAKPEIVVNVPPSCFMPQPKVGSAVIRLTRHSEPPVTVKSEKLLFQVIRASFNQRRKTLANGLANYGAFGLPKEEFLCNFLGLILAIVINRKETKCKAFWRTCFVISIAVPQFVSLLVMRQMLQEHGAINNLLMEWGLIQNPLPFWTNTMWARVSVILINCWVGIPYTMLQVTGVLQNVPAELYEAAKIDGANAAQIFRKITLPYIMFIMGPYIITQFTGNINNFNVIYLLSAGKPTPVGETAGKTDLLVTWLYKLTVDYQYYNIGAVIGILTFVVLSIVALVTYRNTKAYKDEEGFM